MTEPKRWVDDGAPAAIEHMLRAAGDEQPSNASLERTLAGIGAGAAALTATTGSAAAGAAKTATAVGGFFTKWSVLVLVTTSALGVATGVSIVRHEASTTSGHHDVTMNSSTNVKAATHAATPKSEALAPIESAAPVASAEPQTHRAPSNASSEASDAIDTAFLRETRALDQARAALDSGNPSRALALLDDYQSRFNSGQLAPEALYLRMRGLLAQGRTVEARQAASRLLAAYPNSPLAGRAEAVLRNNP